MEGLTSPSDSCPNCGREWPRRLGDHNCNFHRAYIHNNAVVVAPGCRLLDGVQLLTSRNEKEACRSDEYAALGGEDSPYPQILGDIDQTIAHLKQHRQRIQFLSRHAHEWGADDFCIHCSADGRA